jgi:hypothetical protein
MTSSLSVRYGAPSFEAGTSVVGSIILSVRQKSLKVKRFVVSLNLSIELRGVSPVFLRVRECPYLTVPSESSEYAVGEYEIPFEYRLPAELPSSGRLRISSTEYQYLYQLVIDGKNSLF